LIEGVIGLLGEASDVLFSDSGIVGRGSSRHSGSLGSLGIRSTCGQLLLQSIDQLVRSVILRERRFPVKEAGGH
jgi:hypothetical protein